jgi:hypothetical protein
LLAEVRSISEEASAARRLSVVWAKGDNANLLLLPLLVLLLLDSDSSGFSPRPTLCQFLTRLLFGYCSAALRTLRFLVRLDYLRRVLGGRWPWGIFRLSDPHRRLRRRSRLR